MGNAIKGSTKNLYLSNGAKEVEKYFPWNYKKCKNCDVNMFCWPCPGEIKEREKNELAMEEICQRMKKILYKRIWNEVIENEL